MNKRMITLFLALCFVLTAGTVSAAAAEVASGTCGDDLKWVLTDDGTLTISGTGDMYDYDVAMNGMDEDSVDEAPWFFGHSLDIKKVVIEPGCARIGNAAFCNLGKMTEITIPSTVKSIGEWSFRWTPGLDSMVLPEGVVSVEDGAFARSYIKSITIPSTVKNIGAYVFDYTPYLNEVHFIGDAPEIGDDIFYLGERYLETAYYPEGNPTWTNEVMAGFGGENYTTWIPVNPRGEDGFSDVEEENWFYDSVIWAVDNSITTGTSDTTFEPDATCTRNQVVTFLWRAAGEPEPASAVNPFGDVKEGDYFYKAVLWAVEKGITIGTSATTFAPEEPCTRGQVVTFLHRAAEKPAASGNNPFSDVGEAYYTDAVLWAVGEGITTGVTNTTFEPESTCTRAQIVTFLYRNEN